MPLPETVVVSAHSPGAVASAAEGLSELAPRAGSVGALADTTLARGPHGRYRAAVTAADLGSLAQGLRSIQDGAPTPDVIGPAQAPATQPKLVFVYTGHGAHHQAAGLALMRLPVFARAVEEAGAALARQTGYQVWAPGEPIAGFVDAQHCTYLVQVGLTALLAERGITPDLVLGHSVGEIAAAHTAGVLGLDAAARVLAQRSSLLSGLANAGGLLAVRASVPDLEALTNGYAGRITIASYSAPAVQVLAGPTTDLDDLRSRLTEQGIWCTSVPDVIPAHSPRVDPIIPALRQALAGLIPRRPHTAIVSTAHPDQGPDTPALWSPAYWADQARQPVRFTDALRTAAIDLGEQPAIFAEIGPRALLAEHIDHTVPNTITSAVTSDPTGFARGVGELYTAGLTPTGPTARAHPHVVVPPGWDHTGAPPTLGEGGAVPAPAPDRVEAHLNSEIARLVHTPEGLDPASTWVETGLESHSLLQLTSRLRRVVPWAEVDIQLFLPERTWRQVVADLRSRLTPSSKPRAHVLPLH